MAFALDFAGENIVLDISDSSYILCAEKDRRFVALLFGATHSFTFVLQI